jgi:hypothetical protein
LLLVGSLAWTVVALWLVLDVTTRPVYGVLNHRCPLCLFLPEHGLYGYFVFTPVVWALVEASRAWALSAAWTRTQLVAELARNKLRSSTTRLALALAAFLLLSLAPSLIWFARHGTWI